MSDAQQVQGDTPDEAEFRKQLDQFRGEWKGKAKSERAAEIARIAADVLADEGLNRFSMRRVAERAEMTLAALQYHYGSLADLLEAMIAYRLDRYVDLAQGYLTGLSDDPEKAFRRHISEFIDDAMSASTAKFTVQYQALAATDTYAEKALARYMKIYRESLALFIRRMNPGISQAEAVRRGAALAGMIDGTMIVATKDKSTDKKLKGLKRTIENLAWNAATAQGEGKR